MVKYELSGEETLAVDRHEGAAYLYANKAGFNVLAKIFAQLADGTHEGGYHLHLQKDFGESGPDVITIVLND